MSTKFGRWQGDRQVIPDLPGKQKKKMISPGSEESQLEAGLGKVWVFGQQLALSESLWKN